MESRTIVWYMCICLLLIRHGSDATTAPSGGQAEESHNSRPNVVILLADDLGIGDLGCYGNDTIRTPAIDRLAKEGARLTHHLTAATICTPSRAALMTSRYPQRYGLAGTLNTPPVVVHVASTAGLPVTEPTLGTAFTAAGYDTHFTGKWHLGGHCSVFGRNCRGPLAHGFDSTLWLPFTLIPRSEGKENFAFWVLTKESAAFLVSLVTLAVVLVSLFVIRRRPIGSWCQVLALTLALILALILAGSGWLLLTHYRLHTSNWWQVSGWMDHQLNGVVMNRTSPAQQPAVLDTLDARMAADSLRFMRQPRSRPFLLFHSFTHVHTPLVTATSNRGRSVHGRYGDSVEEMDSSVGAILQALDELSLTDNTVVYFTSDHGGHLEALGDDGQRTGGYNGLYKGGKGMGGMEGGLRVPGIIRYPNVVPAGVDVDHPTSLLDALPTLLHLAGLPDVHRLLPHLPAATNVDGVNFADILTQSTNDAQSPNDAQSSNDAQSPNDAQSSNDAQSPNDAQSAKVAFHNKDRVLLHHAGQHLHAVRYVTGSEVYKLHLRRPLFSPGSYQCGWGEEVMCRSWMCPLHCQDLTTNNQSLLYHLNEDPYEDAPLPADSDEYRHVVPYLFKWLQEWHAKVHYPPSQMAVKADMVLLPWLQPYTQQWLAHQFTL